MRGEGYSSMGMKPWLAGKRVVSLAAWRLEREGRETDAKGAKDLHRRTFSAQTATPTGMDGHPGAVRSSVPAHRANP